MVENKWYVASCSHGKDSQAMVLGLIHKGYPLDEVIFYDTGVEYNAIYKEAQKLKELLSVHGIRYTVIQSQDDFFYDMLKRPVCSKTKGEHCGYGWCGGGTRWGTSRKVKQINKYCDEIKAQGFEVVQYVGIAADEKNRIQTAIENGRILPLVEWGWTEADCLEYCKTFGCTWKEDNGVCLYDVLDRVSCWCCSNKNLKELENIYTYLPQYWNKLLELQSKIQKPMKRYKNEKYGEYGNLFILQEIFEKKHQEQKSKQK